MCPFRAYKSGQQSMRVAVYGTKHDAATFERLLRDICVFEPVTQSRASAMIDTAVLGCPKVSPITTSRCCCCWCHRQAALASRMQKPVSSLDCVIRLALQGS